MYRIDDMCAIFCGLIVFLTLQKLSISIQLIFGEISPKKAKFRTRLGEFGCAIFVIMCIGTLILGMHKPFIAKDIQLVFFCAG